MSYQDNNNTQDELLTRRQCWELLRISCSQFDKMRKAPSLNFPKPIDLFGAMRFSKHQLLEWVERRKDQTSPYSSAELSRQLRKELNKDKP